MSLVCVGRSLFSPSEFRDLVSGRRRGLAAALLRAGLRVGEVPYTWAVQWRNRRYENGAYPVHRAAVPVVSVGNLTMGGTGKTPMVAWLARWFRSHAVRVAVISRGYGAEAGCRNDEALELEQQLPDVPHLQNPDRVAAAAVAVEELDSQVIILDDGFQHRRIHRDLDIVLVDALEPFGFNHVFPRGTLREPFSGIRRAHVVALSRADLLGKAERDAIWQSVNVAAPRAVHVEVTHAARTLRSWGGREDAIESLAGRPVAAFCGIGNPTGFRHTLTACGYQVVAMREFPDHYRYGRADVESLVAWSQEFDVDAIVCTAKDLVKLQIERLGSRPLWAVAIGLEILSDQELLEAQLTAVLPSQS